MKIQAIGGAVVLFAGLLASSASALEFRATIEPALAVL